MGTVLIAKKEFARRCGVSAAAITKNCKTGKLPTVDGKIDVSDPYILKYLREKTDPQIPGEVPTRKKRAPRRRTGDPAPAAKKPKAPPRKPAAAAGPAERATDQSNDEYPAIAGVDPVDVPKMTLREIISKFGSDQGLKTWLAALKDIGSVRLSDHKIEKHREELCNRGMVEKVVSHQAALNSELMTTVAPRAAQMCHLMIDTKPTVEQFEAEILKHIEREIVVNKQKMDKAIKNLAVGTS